jgi:hypothetical protein
VYHARVYHWDYKDTARKIQFNMESITLLEFKSKLRVAFADEITTNTFSVYEYPRLFDDPKDARRKHITTDESLLQTLRNVLDPNHLAPTIFVWNEPDDNQHSSPNKLPTSTNKEEIDDMEYKSIATRNTATSNTAKVRDADTCAVCGLLGRPNLEACHFLQIKHYNKIESAKQQQKMLNLVGLSDINQVNNLITMCKNCHENFDRHYLTIHPDDIAIIVTERIRHNVANPYTKSLYGQLHGKIIPEPEFESFGIQKKCVEYRFKTYFTPANRNNHYCWKCPLIFQNESDLFAHVQSNSCDISSSMSYPAMKAGDIDVECEELVKSFEILDISEVNSFESFKRSFCIDDKPVELCTVDELKDFLRKIKGGKLSGKRNELLVRIYQFKTGGDQK